MLVIYQETLHDARSTKYKRILLINIYKLVHVMVHALNHIS